MNRIQCSNSCCCGSVCGSTCNAECCCPFCTCQTNGVFTVVYLPNGGVGGVVDTVSACNSVYMIRTAAQAMVSRAGFTFLSWNTEPDGSGTAFAPGLCILISSNITLYAIWQQNS